MYRNTCYVLTYIASYFAIFFQPDVQVTGVHLHFCTLYLHGRKVLLDLRSLVNLLKVYKKIAVWRHVLTEDVGLFFVPVFKEDIGVYPGKIAILLTEFNRTDL